MIHLLEYSPIAQFAVGMDHKILSWNKACELLTGFSATEMVGTDRQWEPFYPAKRPVVADLIIDDDFDLFHHYYKGKNGRHSSVVPNAWEAASYFPSLGGQSRYIYFLAAPICDTKGKMIGAVETLQDFTRQKQLETYLKSESDKLRQENITLKSAMTERYRFGGIIGKSNAMQDVYELITSAAATDSNVIIYGESGTGKELVARAIHQMSCRREREFVLVNSSAIPETLLESEFFGYRKGAFTGAHADKPGFLDRAENGTIFLDEIGDISLNMQVKLLRAIDGGGYSPLGSSITKTPKIRIIAATNRDPEILLRQGLMREDFYYRIHIIPIHLPPLRDRKEDLPLLIDHFLRQFGSHNKLSGISGKIYCSLQEYNWPGNVRELQNVLHRYLALNRLDFSRKGTGLAMAGKSNPAMELSSEARELGLAVEEFEKAFIIKTLNGTNWHKSRAAELLGISRKTLFRKMQQLGIK